MSNTNQTNEKSIQDQKEQVTAIVNRLEWVFVDGWKRPVFLDSKTEKFYCTTEVEFTCVFDTKKASPKDKARIEKLKQEFILGQKGLCTKINNELDGEPGYVINRYSK